MRALSVLVAAAVSACASVGGNRADSQLDTTRPGAASAHYMSCGLPSYENKIRCFERAKAACVNGFTVKEPPPGGPGAGLVYECS
jgi:hypothetical protein